MIAQTAHSRMYLAEDDGGRKVALKELMFALVPGVEQIAAFEREAAVLRALQHSQIPAFVRAFTEGSGVGTRLYLAQEFIHGESLLQRLARQRLTEEEAWSLAEQALDVLHHLHTREPRLVHRDVKPANLILRDRGPMALVDFGAVRDLARELTHGSTLVGTFGYMPPEQLGGTVDATSDLYALGATLLHGLTGIPPSDLLVDGMELKFDHKLQDVSSELRAFLKRLVAPRRSGRFASAEAALEALRARGQTVLKSDALKRAQQLQKQQRAGSLKRTVAVLGGTAAVLGLMFGGLYTFFSSAQDRSLVGGLSGDDVYIPQTGTPVDSHAGQAGEQVVPSGEQQDHRYFKHTATGVQMRLAVGEHSPIPFQHIERIAVGDPTVVDATPTELIGVRPGQTDVVVWTRHGQTAISVTVGGAGQ
ncbi:MAG TPA: protein kinase [Myxococcales bacterium]|nr:protein kinase [Myxococcales bacterium]